MKFVILFLFCGSLFAESMYFETSVKGDTNKVAAELKKKLEAGFGTVREMKFSETVKSQGKDFHDYTMLLSCNSDKTGELLKKNPAISSLLPCTVVVYDAGKGQVNIAFANAAAFMRASGKSDKEVLTLYKKLQTTIGMKFKPGKNFSSTNFFRQLEAEDLELDEFNMLLVSSLQGENLNVVFSSSYGDSTVHYVCSASLGSVILAKMPEFGVLAPCRIIVTKKQGKLMISFVNITGVVAAAGGVTATEKSAAEKLDKAVANAVEMATSM